MDYRTLILAALISVDALPACAIDAVRQHSEHSAIFEPVRNVSANYIWKPVAIGGGGYITGLDMDSKGKTRVARADVHGAYIWLPAENRWAQLVTSASMPTEFQTQAGADQGVYEVVVAPSQPDRIYLALKGHVFRSDDRGVHFIDMTKHAPFPIIFDANSEFRIYGPFITVDPSDPDFVFLGTPNDGLWRSSDGGANWARVQTVPPAKPLRSVGVQRNPGIISWYELKEGKITGRIWVMSPGNGIYLSKDKGQTFSPLPSLSSSQPTTLTQGEFAKDGTFFGVDIETKSVWKYQNGSWADLTRTKALPLLPFAAIAIQPITSEIFVFDQGGTTYASSDRGISWRWLFHSARVGKEDPPWLPSGYGYFCMSRVRFDPDNADRFWVGSGTGVFYADIPKYLPWIEWTSKTRGIEELVAQDVNQSQNRAPLFAALDFGIFRKEDLDQYSTIRAPTDRRLMAAQQLATAAGYPDFVATNASDTTTFFCCRKDNNGIAAGFSFDAGRSWSKFPTFPTPPGTSPQDPWRMSFGSIAVSTSDPNNIVWEPSFYRAPFVTKDLGKTWTRVTFEGEILPLTGSHRDLWLPRKALVADPVRAGEFYLVHSGNPSNPGLAGLWRSQDGGSLWNKIFNGEIAPVSEHAAKLRAVPGREGDLFFTSAQLVGFDTRLRRSRDGGRTWSALDEVDRVDDVAFGRPAPSSSDPTIFLSGRISGEYGIWRSVDDAKSWTRIATFPIGRLDRVQVMGGDADHFGRIYLGYTGSGFIYGEPSDCKPTPYAFPAQSDCVPTR